MVMVVPADGVDPDSLISELGADCGHEAHRFEAGVDVESYHLAWERIFDSVGVS